MRNITAFCVAFLLFAGFSIAQEQYGNIRGVVVDEEGGLLPGIAVTLESESYNPRSIITSEKGIFRFINVSLGKWRVKCELSGFKTYIQEDIDIRVGINFDLRIVMTPITLEEQVTVVAVSPIVDTKKTGIVTNVTQEMLQELPSARDPWVIFQQIPGILVDRENVGGSESGQQSWFLSKGSLDWNHEWNMDGVPITDMSATAVGASSTYYDFDIFEEIQVVTGGQDASIQTGGISINFISRRGRNKLQAMGRAFFTNDDLQGDNRTQELEDMGYIGNQIKQIMDYGFQVGGPIKKDKFWFWLGYGVQDIRHLTIDGYPDDATLEGFNTKLNFQISRKNKAELSYIYNTKTKYGRGAGPQRPPETTLDQEGQGHYFKFEFEHVSSDNLLLSMKFAYQNGGFQLSPQGGMDVQTGYDMATGVLSGSLYYYETKRLSYVAKVDGNYFLENILGGDHEFKFGVEYRLLPNSEMMAYAGDVYKYYWNGTPFYAEVLREGIWDYKSDRLSFYLNDAYTIGRLTLNLGFRFDREDSINNDVTVKASRVAPDLLPALTYTGVDPGIAFSTFSPRIGFTYDLTGDGKTIVRGNVARYGAQQGGWHAYWISTSSLAYAGYSWMDLNKDDQVTTDELFGYPNDGLLWFDGFDPWNPTKLESPNEIDENLKPELTDELILGIEREIFPDFSMSATFMLRRNHRFLWEPLYDKESQTKITQEDYIGPFSGSVTINGETYNYEYWSLNQYRPPGRYQENRPDYHQNYMGIEISAIKHLSHKWMMNASFTYQTHNVHFGEKGYDDPTNIDKYEGARDVYWQLWRWMSSSYPNADWMAKLSFLYKLPWGINISCFANARQGFIYPQWIEVKAPERRAVGLEQGTTTIITEKPGDRRYPNFYNVDLSLTKDIRFENYGILTLLIDAFNVFNFSHTLARYPQINSPRYNEIEVILNPSVIRFGLRYRF
jgi:hypothetical protein